MKPEAHAAGVSRRRDSGVDDRRDHLLEALGRRVRALRSAHGLSQQALAARAGLSPRFVAQLESGAGNISVAKLAEVARALGTALERLLSGEAAGLAAHAAANGAAGPLGEDDAEALRREIAATLHGRPADALRALLASLRAPPASPGTTPIALVGLRGAGKSTVGPLLARALGRRFVELDEEIQDGTGLAISEIFELHGEDYYRAAERQALERLLAQDAPVVLAASGGAVTDPALFRLLRESTLLVWVQATPEQHMARVAGQGDRRPMADRPNAMAELRALLTARVPYYEQARLIADTSAQDPRACVAALVARLKRLEGW